MGTVIELFSREEPENPTRVKVELPDPFGPLTEEGHERFMSLARDLDTTTDHQQIVEVMRAIQREVVGWSVT